MSKAKKGGSRGEGKHLLLKSRASNRRGGLKKTWEFLLKEVWRFPHFILCLSQCSSVRTVHKETWHGCIQIIQEMENTTHQLNKNIGDLLVNIFFSSLFIGAGFKRLYSSHVYEEVVLSLKCRVNYLTALTFLLCFSGLVHGDDLKPFLRVFNPFTVVCEPTTLLYRTFIFCVVTKKSSCKFFPQETNKSEKKQAFKKQMRAAKTFTDLVSQLEERIAWCKSHRMKKEKCLLSFLHFKCRRMRCLEAEGYK